jgi:hypothetical protein
VRSDCPDALIERFWRAVNGLDQSRLAIPPGWFPHQFLPKSGKRFSIVISSSVMTQR